MTVFQGGGPLLPQQTRREIESTACPPAMFTYWTPPGSLAKIVNPEWNGEPATVGYSKDTWTQSREQRSLLTRADALMPIYSDKPLVVEWYLKLMGNYYTSNASLGLLTGTVAGRWALSDDWLYSGVLTIQDRSAKANDPGYSNRPLQVFDETGGGYGPSQVMERGAMTLHHLQGWQRLKDGAAPWGQGWWTVDFEWAEGAAWSLLHHKLGTDTKRANSVGEWTHLQQVAT